VKKDVDTFQKNIELEAKAAAGLGDSSSADSAASHSTLQATGPSSEATPETLVDTAQSGAASDTTADNVVDTSPAKSAS
jgi:hypothetical protein